MVAFFMATNRQKSFALITENNSHLTGGRYYSWMLAVAMKEAGFNITVHTNAKPTFLNFFSEYKHPKVVVHDCDAKSLADVDIKADVYLGSPVNGNLCAIKNALKYQKQAFPIIFDPLPMIKKYLGKSSFPDWAQLFPLLKNNDLSIITLCRATHPFIYSWLNKTDDKLIPIYPSINSLAKNKTKSSDRENYAVFVSRLVPNKKFDHVVWACRQNNLKLKVITSVSGINHRHISRAYRMNNLIEFIFNASEEEKFEVIRKASVMINGAIFEGFGMWAAEAIDCGTPVVCYDYPTLKEIADFSKAQNMYFARLGSHVDLSRKLGVCLAQRKFEPEKNIFGFDQMVKRVKEVFKNV